MSTGKRALIICIFLVIVALVLLLPDLVGKEAKPATAPQDGMIHIYVDGQFAANVIPSDLAKLSTASFEDAEKGKTQEGPTLENVILLYVSENDLRTDSVINVSSPSGQGGVPKSASVTWAQAIEPSNHVLLDANRTGDALKLVSSLPDLDTRAEWVQGVARIDITTQP